MEQELLKTMLTVLITTIVSSTATGVITYVLTMKKVAKILKDGLLALLRAEIIRYHDKYYQKKKYCPLYAKDALEKMYGAYHALGGNGAMTKLYEDIMNLPVEEVI